VIPNDLQAKIARIQRMTGGLHGSAAKTVMANKY
jgi:hypothetical protein